jgi:hypothetical protein
MQRLNRAKEAVMNHFLFLSVLIFSVFSFLAVAVWSENRRKERESYYRGEALKKIAEGTGGGAAVEFLREQDKLARRARHEGIRIGGIVTSAVSVAFTLFLHVVTTSNRPGVWTLGLIPLSVGLALLAYGYLLAPKEPQDAARAGK